MRGMTDGSGSMSDYKSPGDARSHSHLLGLPLSPPRLPFLPLHPLLEQRLLHCREPLHEYSNGGPELRVRVGAVEVLPKVGQERLILRLDLRRRRRWR